VARALALFGLDALRGKSIFLKPNFNSADPPPGSTHEDVLRTLVQRLQAAGAGEITVGDRSGMGETRAVMAARGAFRLAEELGFATVVFDELPADEWEVVHVPGEHWQQGFALPRPALAAGAIVQTCCLKTHRFGGHFTLSLKNSVGFAAKRVPGGGHDYMLELHSSPYQRLMIAEINAAYRTALVVLDGVEAFVDGGPDYGTKVASQVVLAAADRVAIDAVGVAILRHYGTTPGGEPGADLWTGADRPRGRTRSGRRQPREDRAGRGRRGERSLRGRDPGDSRARIGFRRGKHLDSGAGSWYPRHAVRRRARSRSPQVAIISPPE
jgi:uncharacterized protein (DUF362 family)